MVDTGACDSLYGKSWITPYVQKCLMPFNWHHYIGYAECHARFRGIGKGIKTSSRRGRIPIATGGKSALFEGQELPGSEPGILGLASLLSKRAVLNLCDHDHLHMTVDAQDGSRESISLYLANGHLMMPIDEWEGTSFEHDGTIYATFHSGNDNNQL